MKDNVASLFSAQLRLTCDFEKPVVEYSAVKFVLAAQVHHPYASLGIPATL